MAVQWGDVPTWVGAILTSGSVFAAYLTLRRAQRRAERRQADQIHVVLVGHHVDHAFEGTLTVHNRSTAPIYQVKPLLVTLTWKLKWYTSWVHWVWRSSYRRQVTVLPDGGDSYPRLPYLLNGWKVEVLIRSKQSPEDVVEFRDASGRFWWRSTDGDTIAIPVVFYLKATDTVPGAPTPVKDE